MKKVTLWIIAGLLTTQLTAQQVPLLARYQMAAQWYNPAETGKEGALHFGAAFRRQWLGIEGGPSTQLLYVDQSAQRVGYGCTVMNDRAGALGITDLSGAYAWGLPLDRRWSLRGGLSASVANWRSDWSSLRREDLDDPVFQNNINRWMPNFGAGLYLSHPSFSLGLSAPRLLEYRFDNSIESRTGARNFRHFFAAASGYLKGSHPDWIYLPQVLIGTVNRIFQPNTAQHRAPAAMDMGVTVLYRDQWQAGLSWRTSLQRARSSDQALSLQAGWLLPIGARLYIAYDLPLNALRRSTDGSVELGIRYAPPRSKPAPIPAAPAFPTIPPEPAAPALPAPTPVPEPALPPVKPNLSPETPPTEGEVLVQGIVFDMNTGLPCEKARITLKSTCKEEIFPAFITLADGTYRFTLRQGCCYRITAEKDGFTPATVENICPEKQPNATVLKYNLDLFRL